MKLNDLSSYWMPFTVNRQFKAAPRMIVGAQGMYFQTDDGREILDGTAGLWCSNAGHGQPRIVEAIQQQAAKLDYAPPFQMGSPAQFELANRLVDLAPEGFGQVFYCNSGSEAVETALKTALAWQRARGEGTRTRLVGRERGYHGINFGGISVGGIVGNRAMFGALLAGVDHLRHTHDPQRNLFTQGVPEHGADLADDLERLVQLHGAQTIAACIVEPIACSTGVLVPPRGYLERLRSICDRHGILLIFDEVITGFGRLGTPFAAQRFGVTPDIITMAKGLTNGTVPMGGILVREGIYETICAAAAEGAVELPHGYTYSGHPLACAAALASLDVYREEGLFERAAGLEPLWQEAVHSLRGLAPIVDIRNLGLIAGIELEAGPNGPGTRAFEIYRRCWEEGVLIRVTGDIIALSPPLIIEEGQVAHIVDTLRRIIAQVD
ncbi:aspartate aminotransferase family protein [Novosphingobium decolorationis]|uniref:Aspartate aminotransferase family protein n=1 Tax=Novosphingobium decolorationis TaxID=2698673 RepID=A0ABX8E700_9SPHN|nr:aspartate aminotransferase family protein [Novosphingobium decolorationis]QVM84757.1 aspartate aminotransferase family protein [Novosphingobium decolorationis]